PGRTTMESKRLENNSMDKRQLSTLKIVSRLLAHELHAQGNSKAVTMSHDEVREIQNTLDLFISNASRSAGKAASAAASTKLVTARN
ncbi:MAG: hypothetical protein QF411_03295, partial [Planctomycetota bacterium]|nr:hypothetical protein [Planctomycetota bacterium]